MMNSRLTRRKRASNRRRQRTRNNGPSSTTTIKSLPRDLLLEVVANVASRSFIDLHIMKKCCKDFLDAAEDNYVWQRICLDKFPLIQWIPPNDKEWSFLKRCREYENMESLFREGLQEYFNYPKEKIGGLESLKMASQKGHKEATYVYGMILISSKDDELRKQGIERMRFLRKSKCIIRCRNKVKQLSEFLWKKNGMLVRNETPLCNHKNTCEGWRVKKGLWLLLEDDDEDISSCEYCRWDHELELFYELFNVH